MSNMVLRDASASKIFLQNIVSSSLRIKIFLKCCWNNWKIFETLAKNSNSSWDLRNKFVEPTEFQAFKGKLNVPTCFQGKIYCVSWTRGATRWNSFGYCLSIHQPPPVATPHLLQRVFSGHLGHLIKASYISQGFQFKYDFYFRFDQYICHLTPMQRFVQLILYTPHAEIESPRIS